MACRGLLAATALAVALAATAAAAEVPDNASYPDWKGQWGRIGSGDWDPSRPAGLGQLAPLTPEYQGLLEAGLADQARGGQGTDPGYQCRPHGMPRMMIGILPLEFIITPEVTFIERPDSGPRRVYTDGRDFPERVAPSFVGYSIGKWLDANRGGHYDTLIIETRGLKGPRSYDGRGIPLHADDQSIVKERISLDNADRNVLHNEITTIDHALTRPWTVTRTYRRDPGSQPVWVEYVCGENNVHVVIGNEDYIVNASDGNLMPVRKGQAPPDLRYFKPAPK
jgi:hypothetical protein